MATMVFQIFITLVQGPRELVRRGQRGQTLVEYGLILALIALGAVAALTAFQLSMDGLYDKVSAAADAMISAVG